MCVFFRLDYLIDLFSFWQPHHDHLSVLICIYFIYLFFFVVFFFFFISSLKRWHEFWLSMWACVLVQLATKTQKCIFTRWKDDKNKFVQPLDVKERMNERTNSLSEQMNMKKLLFACSTNIFSNLLYLTAHDQNRCFVKCTFCTLCVHIYMWWT